MLIKEQSKVAAYNIYSGGMRVITMSFYNKRVSIFLVTTSNDTSKEIGVPIQI